jgi:hypothetical protein
MGLLDGLTDPEVMARIAERQRLVEHVAAQLGVTPQEARVCLDNADAIAAETFCEGNVIPFRARQ